MLFLIEKVTQKCLLQSLKIGIKIFSVIAFHFHPNKQTLAPFRTDLNPASLRDLCSLDSRFKGHPCGDLDLGQPTATMKVSTPSICWHSKKRVSSVDFQPTPFPSVKSSSGQERVRLASSGDDEHVLVSKAEDNKRLK